MFLSESMRYVWNQCSLVLVNRLSVTDFFETAQELQKHRFDIHCLSEFRKSTSFLSRLQHVSTDFKEF